MSSEPLLKPTPYGVETDKGFISTETWSAKFQRKFKENPLVPIGAFALPLPLSTLTQYSQAPPRLWAPW